MLVFFVICLICGHKKQTIVFTADQLLCSALSSSIVSEDRLFFFLFICFSSAMTSSPAVADLRRLCERSPSCSVDRSSSPGATNSCSRSSFFAEAFSFAIAFFSSFFCRSRAAAFTKNSPLSSCRSILLGTGAGGKGVYGFFSRSTCGLRRLLVFFFLKTGKKRLQSSLARFGSCAR